MNIVRDCVSYHEGKFPKECFTNGFVNHYGEQVSIEEFEKQAKIYRSKK